MLPGRRITRSRSRSHRRNKKAPAASTGGFNAARSELSLRFAAARHCTQERHKGSEQLEPYRVDAPAKNQEIVLWTSVTPGAESSSITIPGSANTMISLTAPQSPGARKRPR
jgi:hypothetical protein